MRRRHHRHRRPTRRRRGDDKRFISISIYKDSDGEPDKCNYNFFDKNENYKKTSKYKVTSWDDVIDHFIFDEIELIK